jgi:hypothetical protein
MIAIFFVNNRQVELFEKLGVKELPTGYGYLKESDFKEPLVFYHFKTPQRTTGFHEQMATTQASSFPNAYFEIFQKIVNCGYVSGFGNLIF